MFSCLEEVALQSARSVGLRPRGPHAVARGAPAPAPAGAPVARSPVAAASSNEYKLLVSSRETG